MTARRETALAALNGVIDGISSIAGLQHFRNPHFEMDRFPATALWDGPMRLVEETGELKIYELSPIVEGYIRAPAGANVETAGTVAGQAANALYAAIVGAIYADRTLGAVLGVGEDVFEGDLDWDVLEDEGSQVHIEFALELRVVIQTAVNDPESVAP